MFAHAIARFRFLKYGTNTFCLMNLSNPQNYFTRDVSRVLFGKILLCCCRRCFSLVWFSTMWLFVLLSNENFSRRKLYEDFRASWRTNSRSNFAVCSQFVSVFSSCRKLKIVLAFIKMVFFELKRKSGKIYDEI